MTGTAGVEAAVRKATYESSSTLVPQTLLAHCMIVYPGFHGKRHRDNLLNSRKEGSKRTAGLSASRLALCRQSGRVRNLRFNCAVIGAWLTCAEQPLDC